MAAVRADANPKHIAGAMVMAARLGYQARQEQLIAGKARVDLLLESSARLLEAELAGLTKGKQMSENQRPKNDLLEEAIEAFQRMTVPDPPSDAELLHDAGERARRCALPIRRP